MYYNNSSFRGRVPYCSCISAFLSRLSTPWFIIELREFRFCSSVSTRFPGKIEVTRSNTVGPGSNEKDSGRSITFNTSVQIFEASANTSSITYPRLNNTGRCTKTYVFQIPCLLSDKLFPLHSKFGRCRGANEARRELQLCKLRCQKASRLLQ